MPEGIATLGSIRSRQHQSGRRSMQYATVKAALTLMRAKPKIAAAQVTGCKVLRSTAAAHMEKAESFQSLQNRKAPIIEMGAIRPPILALEAFPEDKSLAQECMFAILHLILFTFQASAHAGELGAIERVLAVQKRWPNDPAMQTGGVQGSFMEPAGGMCCRSSAVGLRGSGYLPSDPISAMRKLMPEGIATLDSTSSGQHQSRRWSAQHGRAAKAQRSAGYNIWAEVSAALTAMRAKPTDAAAQMSGCTVLFHAAHTLSTTAKFFRSIRSRKARFVKMGAIEPPIVALEAFPDDKSLAQVCSSAILMLNLFTVDTATRAGELGGVERVLAVQKRWPNDPAMQTGGVQGSFMDMVPANRVKWAEAGGIDECFASIKRFYARALAGDTNATDAVLQCTYALSSGCQAPNEHRVVASGHIPFLVQVHREFGTAFRVAEEINQCTRVLATSQEGADALAAAGYIEQLVGEMHAKPDRYRVSPGCLAALGLANKGYAARLRHAGAVEALHNLTTYVFPPMKDLDASHAGYAYNTRLLAAAGYIEQLVGELHAKPDRYRVDPGCKAAFALARNGYAARLHHAGAVEALRNLTTYVFPPMKDLDASHAGYAYTYTTQKDCGDATKTSPLYALSVAVVATL
eukprot:CAMPEP_0119343880 /NCGR_PEP_ID=MMETSP1333-20130426/106682_1 /TAXON_ID=418940 /ORGANISM="Scyphosphaera apsteinii, Strain RCC1455" /LENGTH=633 /DNA_ID=CAMNT_0007356297 /DNA_START=1865 /DNA_END=3767 /DNA_ORIENTATION=+